MDKFNKCSTQIITVQQYLQLLKELFAIQYCP